MKIIKQSHHFIHEPDLMKLIELAGRTCYKSEDKITDDSAKRFVQMITKAGHYSVLEHASICFEIDGETSDYLGFSLFNKYLNWGMIDSRYLVSGNFRAWLEFFQKTEENELTDDLLAIYNSLYIQYPEIFSIAPSWGILETKVKQITEDQMTSEEKLVHATRTCRFIMSRIQSQSLIRHRPWAFSQESTRYIAYREEVEYILPTLVSKDFLGIWKNNDGPIAKHISEYTWFNHMKEAASVYQQQLQNGWRAEDARGVLPNDLKTEIVCTAPLAEWKHMLGLRTSKAAHPQIRALMIPALKELQKNLPEIFLPKTEKI